MEDPRRFISVADAANEMISRIENPYAWKALEFTNSGTFRFDRAQISSPDSRFGLKSCDVFGICRKASCRLNSQLVELNFIKARIFCETAKLRNT